MFLLVSLKHSKAITIVMNQSLPINMHVYASTVGHRTANFLEGDMVFQRSGPYPHQNHEIVHIQDPMIY